MAKGYPSRKRARKAYWRGVKVARTGRGRNPYLHPVLKNLFERGRSKAPSRAAPPGGMRQGNSMANQPSRATSPQSSSGGSGWGPRLGDRPRS